MVRDIQEGANQLPIDMPATMVARETGVRMAQMTADALREKAESLGWEIGRIECRIIDGQPMLCFEAKRVQAPAVENDEDEREREEQGE